jgi:hypothetical protein
MCQRVCPLSSSSNMAAAMGRAGFGMLGPQLLCPYAILRGWLSSETESQSATFKSHLMFILLTSIRGVPLGVEIGNMTCASF